MAQIKNNFRLTLAKEILVDTFSNRDAQVFASGQKTLHLHLQFGVWSSESEHFAFFRFDLREVKEHRSNYTLVILVGSESREKFVANQERIRKSSDEEVLFFNI